MKLHAYDVIKRLPNSGKITRVIFLSLTFIALFLGFTPWQQFALGEGKVIAFSPTERLHTLNSPVQGRVKKWYVDEGMQVKIGDPIVDINDNDPHILRRLTLEKEAIQLRLDAANKSMMAGKAHLDRQKMLFEEGINSKRQYELAQIEYAKFQNDLAQANIDNVNIDVRIARQKTQNIKAQVAGTIFRRLTGQESVVVKQGDVLAQILPATQSRAVELWIDGNDIPFVHLNQKARLQFEGWPAVQFRGWPEIAVGTFGGKVSFIDATEPLLRDRLIDKERASLMTSEESVMMKQHDAQAIKIKIYQEAIAAYWQWVEAGLQLEIFEELLKLAETRQHAIERQAKAGDIARLVISENLQQMMQREQLINQGV